MEENRGNFARRISLRICGKIWNYKNEIGFANTFSNPTGLENEIGFANAVHKPLGL